MRRCRLPWSAALAVLALWSASSAQVPTTVPFQARLVDSGGAPIGPGTLVVFEMFDAQSGGSSVWGPESHIVTPVNGVVSVHLGAGDPAVPVTPAVFTGAPRHLEVRVAGTTLTPRFRMGAVGYALRAGSVVTGAVGSPEVIDGSLATADLADDSVTSGKIATAAVGTPELADDAVTSGKIPDGAVGTSELASSAVTTAKILDATVGTADLANDSVTSAKIASGTIVSEDLATGAVASVDILDGSVAAADLASDAVTAAAIGAGAVGSSEVADGSLLAADLGTEPGVAAGQTVVDEAVSTIVENIVTRQIIAPGPGYVVAIAEAEIMFVHHPGQVSDLLASVSTVSATIDTTNARYLRMSTGDTIARNFHACLTVQDVFTVGAAGALDVYFVATYPTDATSNSTVTVRGASLVLMYFPTSYGLLPSTDGAVTMGRPGGPATASAARE